MKRIVWFFMCTLTVVVLLFGYHTSTSAKAAGGETAFVSTAQAGSAVGSESTSSSTAAAVTPSSTAAAPAVTTPPATTSSSAPAAATTSTGKATPSTSSPATATATKATTSTITGDVTDTQWGPVQVQLTVANGKITAVSVLQYPNGNGKDGEINSYALPILVQETISAQSAKIDMVSGATVTSGGYLGSLQSALDKL
jgi:uncharacterized protein with FMN-binding domain